MQKTGRRPAGVDLRRPKGYPAPQPPPAAKEQAPAPGGDPCPRCESRDTKFCYYNNYNTSQPRHFCKSCRRYWTKGGSLRNVPVGGGTRKSSSSSSSSSPGAAPKSPKRSSKRRRVAPATDPAAPRSTDDDASSNADDVADNRAPPTTPAAPASAEAAQTVAAEDHRAATPAAEGGLIKSTSASVALGLGVSTDVGGVGGEKQEMQLPDPGQFEWPSSCDLAGSFWGSTTGVFADTDPALFLNLP